MNNQTQSTRKNTIEFTGNVSQVKPIQGGACAISLAYNEGSMVNGQWETKDTLFLEAYIPAKLNFQPNIGDKMTVLGFMTSNNYQPQNGKKRYGMKVVVNQIVEYSEKTVNNAAQPTHYNNAPQEQYAPQGQYTHAPQQRAPQQHTPQGQYANAPQQRAPQQHTPQGQYANAPQQRAPQQHTPQGQYANAPQQHAPQGQYANAPQQRAPQQQYNSNRPQNSFQRGTGFQN